MQMNGSIRLISFDIGFQEQGSGLISGTVEL